MKFFKKNPFKTTDELWKKTKDGIEIHYPISYLDLDIPDEPTIYMIFQL